ncbi:hypothetical protein DTL21_08990 [Bremerella cremea]|uniref:Uncharacterized protein n=1 Tax=Blastopirellula marina TaxID=124 RepID=A0A2S8FV42_9BACT|nr:MULTISPECIES: hypothetical protein [Pirellulaceae]PQO36051.1 hypothetical protein C5Y83_08985 [Blastopirellula marina]RCS48728.1 hypothetical protein DTL21_08990 [Bremerella cremea]
MFRTTTLAACVMFAAPSFLSAQQPAWNATSNNQFDSRPMTRLAAPKDLNDPNAIELSSSRGTADRVGDIQRISAVKPISHQGETSVMRTYVGQPVTSQTRVVAETEVDETVTRYSSAPQTIVYDNPQPITQQQVRRVEYPSNYQTQTSYYVQPVRQPGTWHSVGETVQRVEYNAPVTYSAPVATTTGTPVTVYRPTTTIAYNNPPVTSIPVATPPVVTQAVPVPNATVYPVDRTAYRPVLPIIGMPNNSYVGRGLLGQPEVYTEGQPIRNALRYIFP